MKTYNFYPEDAQRYGLNEAVILYNLKFWAQTNMRNNHNFHDGNWWTYNTLDAFVKWFPWWNKYQIQRFLKSLIAQKAIMSGSYSKNKFDRTVWYAVLNLNEIKDSWDDESGQKCNVDIAESGSSAVTGLQSQNDPEAAELLILQKCNVHVADMQYVRRNTDNKPDTKNTSNARNRSRDYFVSSFQKFWELYPNKVGKKSAFKSWSKLTQEEHDACVPALQAQITERELKEDAGLNFIPAWKNPTTWLNQGCWEDVVMSKKEIERQAKQQNRNVKPDPALSAFDGVIF